MAKTYGYAGIPLRMYRLAFNDKRYVIGAGSVATEARLIERTKATTMPVIFDDTDFITNRKEDSQAKRCLSILKYADYND